MKDAKSFCSHTFSKFPKFSNTAFLTEGLLAVKQKYQKHIICVF